ncbi:Thymidylate kinase [Pestalotiopsis sp. 9143b]|nr:Thymidylate kinase [Pestalotiopsis sp. 9143b]
MSSINDLAAAATIASSAVALQSSPEQQAAQPAAAPSSPTPPPATDPSAKPTSASTPASGSDSAPSQTSPHASSVLVAPKVSPGQQPQAPVTASSPPANQATAASAPGAVDGAGNGPAAVSALPQEEKMKKKKPVRGAFIVFEGMDRAGKTTQAKLLQQRCIEEGKNVKFMRFPDRTTPIGQMIDAYLKGQTEIEDHVIHLLFSANRWEALKSIQTALASGQTIICDRYYHSGIVYSAAKQNPSLPLSWAKAPEVGLPRPDLVLFLDLEESVARERGGWGGEVYEKGEMQRRVRELFWGLSMGDVSGAAGLGKGKRAENGSGGADGSHESEPLRPHGEKGEFRQEEEDLQIVDADLGVEELSEKVWEHVLPRLEQVERGEVGDKVRIVR